ncbi:sensor histidine kinase [Paenibacillus sp. 1P07SE]|uniref:sensor histidine kinase n=1 Tax=Paenibacillus sp. 1P07SE TaxID=3132209 RepID=UPI0039A490DB
MIIAFLLLFVVMTPLGIYLLVKRRENSLLIWGALLMITAGLSGLQVGLEKLALPYMEAVRVEAAGMTALQVATTGLNILIHSFPYYLALGFFMHFAGYSNPMLTGLLLVPVLFSFFFSDVYPVSRMNYTYILSWGVPYMAASMALFGKRVWRAGPGIGNRLPYLGIGLMILIPLTFLLLLQLEGIYFQSPVQLLAFIPFICLISLVLGLVLYVYNVFTRFQSSAALTKMQVGTSLMQHAFKNVVAKNKLHALNIQRSLESKQYDMANHQVKSLLRSNEHLMSMVSRLSYLTRSRLSVEPEATDLSVLLDEVTEQFAHTSVSFAKQYAPAMLLVDRTLIAECLSNIISNAIEAMDGRGQVTVTVEKVQRRVRIHITDTGKGMSKDQLKGLFEPFYSTKHKSGHNFGLGMFHVKKIMTAHRGKVSVVSQPGAGTTVTLLFP